MAIHHLSILVTGLVKTTVAVMYNTHEICAFTRKKSCGSECIGFAIFYRGQHEEIEERKICQPRSDD